MQLVIVVVGFVLWTSLVGIIVLAVLQVAAGGSAGELAIPDELGTICIASMTALGGLLAPNTGLLTSRSARRAEAAGQAAATAVIEAEADELDPDLDHHGRPR